MPSEGERLYVNGSSGECLHLTCLNVSGSNSCTNTQFPGRETFGEEREYSYVLLLSSQCPPPMYIVSVPEDTILRVAIERGKMREHPPAEPNYITRGNGHIV